MSKDIPVHVYKYVTTAGKKIYLIKSIHLQSLFINKSYSMNNYHCQLGRFGKTLKKELSGTNYKFLDQPFSYLGGGLGFFFFHSMGCQWQVW